jgi:hypothetical protein
VEFGAFESHVTTTGQLGREQRQGLNLDFRHLVSAHGEPLLDGAHACVAARGREVFGEQARE